MARKYCLGLLERELGSWGVWEVGAAGAAGGENLPITPKPAKLLLSDTRSCYENSFFAIGELRNWVKSSRFCK